MRVTNGSSTFHQTTNTAPGWWFPSPSIGSDNGVALATLFLAHHWMIDDFWLMIYDCGDFWSRIYISEYQMFGGYTLSDFQFWRAPPVDDIWFLGEEHSENALSY
jgi:hypothetical protein